MKKYLLRPENRINISTGKYWLIRKAEGLDSILDNLWRFIKDKYFLCIHLKYDANQLFQSIAIDPTKPEETQIEKFI